MDVETAPIGATIKGQPGDFMLTRRDGLVQSLISMGERFRFRQNSYWTHAAFFVTSTRLVEAVGHGVRYTDVANYEGVSYTVVHTNMDLLDVEQACEFAKDCVGQRYGFPTLLGIAMRFLTPGRGLWFGMNGTEICSGLVAQALCRGWYNFPVDPATVTPAELARYFNV